VGDRVLVVALLLGLGIVAYREQKAGTFPPRPSVFVGTALVFTLLGVLALASPGLAAAFGIAFDLGLAIRGGQPQPVNLKVISGGQAA
jgi:hypothetical protein